MGLPAAPLPAGSCPISGSCGWLTPGFYLVLDPKNTSKTHFFSGLRWFCQLLGQIFRHFYEYFLRCRTC